MKKKQPRKEVEDGYIFVNIFVKINLTIIPVIFNVSLLIRNAVTIGPTVKPIMLGY